MSDKKSKRNVGVTAAEINKYNKHRAVLGIAVVALTVLLGIVYVVSMLYKVSGSFTISVNKYEMTEYGISLSESRELGNPSSYLNAHIDNEITNIAEEDLPDNVDELDGDHSGRNYIAYTFYLFNAGEIPFSFEWRVTMSNISNGIDDAIRLKLYVDGVPTVYAKTASDGSGAEPGTIPFYSSDVMALARVDDYAPGATTKFTVVMWLEGTDPDCVDWIIGGKMKVDMIMSIIH